MIYVASPLSGTLEHLLVHRGHEVKKGEPLFQLDDNPQTFNFQDAEAVLLQGEQTLIDLISPKRVPEIEVIQAQIGQVNAKINLAKLRYDRNVTLYHKKVLDLDTLDAAKEHYLETLQSKLEFEAHMSLAKLGAREGQIKAQEAAIKSLKAKLNDAKWHIEQKRLYAPTDGIIFDTYFSEGEFVGEQKPVLSLLPWTKIHIEFFVPVTELPTLHLGQILQFVCEGCAKASEAQISYISPQVEYAPPLVYSRDNNDKLIFRVKADIRDARNYKPGQPVTVMGPNDAP